MWYFLERPNYIDEFVKKGIPATSHKITKPKTTDGMIFQGEYLKQALEVLGFNSEDIETKVVKTDTRNINMLIINILPQRKMQRELENRKDEFIKEKEKLRESYIKMLDALFLSSREEYDVPEEYDIPDLSREIYSDVQELKRAYGEVERFYGEKNFAVEFDRLWKMPEIKRIKLTHEYLKVTLRLGFMEKYRIRIPLDRSREGIRIYRSLFSFRPAWVYSASADNNHFGKVCFGDLECQISDVLRNGELVTFIKLLAIFIKNGVRSRFDINLQEGVDIWRPKRFVFDPLKLLRKDISFMSKKRYVQLMREATQENRNDAQKKLIRLQHDINTAKEILMKNFRHEKFSKIKRTEAKGIKDRWTEDFNQLISNDSVDFLTIQDSVIEIFTKSLKMKTEKDFIEVGSFSILINMRDGSIKIENITYENGEYDHPAVRNGFPYFDADLWISLTKILARLDVPLFLSILLEYLQSPQDTLTQPDKWKKN